MSLSIKFTLPQKPFTDLKGQLKEASKEVKDLRKEIDQAKKDGKAVSDDLIKKLNNADNKEKAIRGRLKTEGKALRISENLHEKRTQAYNNLDFKGGLKADAQIMARNWASQSATGQKAMAFVDSGGLKALGKAAGTFAAVGYAAYTLQKIASFHSEDLRQKTRDYKVNMADTHFGTAMDRAIATTEQKKAENETNIQRFTPPGMGTIGGVAQWISNRGKGLDEASMRTVYRMNDLLKTAGVNARAEGNRIQELAEARLQADKYGKVGGLMAQRFNTMARQVFGGFNDTEKATTEKMAAMLQKYTELNAKGMEQSARMDFQGALESFKAASGEINRQGYKDPVNVYSQQQATKAAAVNWAIQQNPLPPLRIGGG